MSATIAAPVSITRTQLGLSIPVTVVAGTVVPPPPGIPPYPLATDPTQVWYLTWVGGALSWQQATIPVAPALTVAAINGLAADMPLTVSGAYFNDSPTAFDYSLDGGVTWLPASGVTVGGGAFSFVIGAGLPAGQYTIQVRPLDAPQVVAISNSFIVTGNSLTITAPSTGASGTALAVAGSVWPISDAVQIALGTSATVAPTTGYVAAASTGGVLSGSLTPGSAGTYYVWANDTVTALTAVSGAIAVT